MTAPDQRLALELLATADALRECVRRTSNLRHSYHRVALDSTNDHAFAVIRCNAGMVADALAHLAAQLSTPKESC